MGAARGGGAKRFWKQFGTGIATPFVATYKKINPQLASKGNQENKRNTIKSTKLRKKSLNKKLGKVSKVKDKLNIPNNSFVFVNPQNKQQAKHNKPVKKVYKKDIKLNKKFEKHNVKSDARQKKWDEKSAKKQEKKSHK